MFRSGFSRCALPAALVFFALVPTHAGAQKFDRPLRLVVPFAPGGVNDVIGRRYAIDMARVLGQNVIVENKAGASGAIGSNEVARAKPDGYTLVIANTTTHVINPVSVASV